MCPATGGAKAVGILKNADLLHPTHALRSTREPRPGLLSEPTPLNTGNEAFTLHIVSRSQQSVVPVVNIDMVFRQHKKLSPSCYGQPSLHFFHRAPYGLGMELMFLPLTRSV